MAKSLKVGLGIASPATLGSWSFRMMLLGTQLSIMLIDLRICLKESSLQMAPIQQVLSSCFGKANL